MATTTARVLSMADVPPATRRGVRLLHSAPLLPLLVLALLGFAAIFAPTIATHDKLQPVKPTPEQCLARFGFPDCPYVDSLPPFWYPEGSLNTPLGTDYLGRDILSRLIYGARISVVVGLTGTLAAGVIGTLLGILAGYLGKWWDHIIMRITDAWLTLPSLVFAILLSSVRGPGLWNAEVAATSHVRGARVQPCPVAGRPVRRAGRVCHEASLRLVTAHRSSGHGGTRRRCGPPAAQAWRHAAGGVGS